MAHPVFRTLVLVAAAGVALSGCEAMRKATSKTDTTGAASDAVAATKQAGGETRDVEAPEVFQTTDKALWDGRPSLGGIWVASPDVKDPERVMMKNAANGKTVVGALFRRERDNPGPKLQLSSDAAEALGLLAGQPATISVTALRRKDVAASAAAAPPATKATTAPRANPTAAAAATQAPPAKAAAAAGGGLIQIASFGQETNARAAADKIAKAGIPAQVRAGTTGDKQIWSVIAGPAPASETPALIARLNSLGFADAYPLSR